MLENAKIALYEALHEVLYKALREALHKVLHEALREALHEVLYEVNLQTGKVTVRRPVGLRPPGPRALTSNLNVATKDKPLSRKS